METLHTPLPAIKVSARTGLFADRQGSVVVETAIIFPLLIVLVAGIVSFGTWFMVAHGVQEAANEGARASLAGLNDTDRRTIAQSSAATAIAVASGIDASRVTTTTARDGTYFTVTVTFQPSDPNWLTYGLVPVPVGAIRRQATVKLSTL